MEAHNEDTPQSYNSPSQKARRAHSLDESSRRPPAETNPTTGYATLARTYRDVAPYLGLGIQLAATIVVCFFLGRWLDQALNTAPWLMIIGAFIGAAGGLYNFLRTVIALGKKQNERKKKNKHSSEISNSDT